MRREMMARNAFRVWDSRLPPEFYGRGREDVSLLAVDRAGGIFSSSPFTSVARFLRKGDLLVFNDSMLIPSSLAVHDPATGLNGRLHVGTSRRGGRFLCEPRPKSFNATLGSGRELVLLGDGSSIGLEERDGKFGRFFWGEHEEGNGGMERARSRFGTPLHYDHVPFQLPVSAYTTLFSRRRGSSEFPSASRPFTAGVVRSIAERGVRFAALTLHCNLSPLEPGEFGDSTALPEEEYSIPPSCAQAVERTKENGGRVVAVGTSVVRALESAAAAGRLEGGGVTSLFIRPGYSHRVADGLITGLHDPESSHIEMISSFLDESLLRSAYSTAQSLGYQWHEFGDLSLIL